MASGRSTARCVDVGTGARHLLSRTRYAPSALPITRHLNARVPAPVIHLAREMGLHEVMRSATYELLRLWPAYTSNSRSFSREEALLFWQGKERMEKRSEEVV